MVLETIIIGFACITVSVILACGGVIGISSYKTIALGLAEIGEAGKNTRERINVRADLAYDSGDGDAEATGGASELDGYARLLGYDTIGSALSDPNIIDKVKSMFGGKE